MGDEVWAQIEDYDYEVSNLGRVRRVSTGKLLLGRTNNWGYKLFTVYFDKKPVKQLFIHREVAKRFCDGYFEGAVVDHIDGDKANNRADNLRWVTQKENIWASYERGLQRCEPRPVKQIKGGRVVAEYPSVAEAFAQTGIRHISEVACGKNGRTQAGGYQWEY